MTMVVVHEIEDQTTTKPFLGGWRDVEREIDYHDAASQTSPRQLPRISVPVQTSERFQCTRSTNATGTERGIQAGPPFPQLGEMIVQATDVQLLRTRQKAASLIQRVFSAYRNRKTTSEVESRSGVKFDGILRGDVADESDEDRSLSVTESKDYQRGELCNYGEFDIVGPSMVRPDDPADLVVLRGLLDRWGVAEEARIRDEMHETDSRIAAQNQRLQQEVEILRAIDTSRTEISRRREELARGKFLSELSKPIDLDVPLAEEQSKRGTVQVETLNVKRAREFRELYDALASGEAEEDEGETDEFDRIELLFAVKKIAWQHTCPASSNLENLIDQELFLMSSRVRAPRLRHLRSRVRLGFLRLARGALRHDNGIKSSLATRLCLSCHRLKRLEAYEADHRGRVSRTCVDCLALRAKQRELELCSEIYEKMLKELRRSESAKPDGPRSLAFVVGTKAIRYLVNDIWHCRSVFSECTNLEQLRLARLDPAEPWSPWNTLLATRHEARMHEALAREVDAVAQVYDAELARKLRRMNLQARLYFETLAKNRRP